MFSLKRGFKPSLMRKIWSQRSFGALVHLPAKEAIQHCDAQAALTAEWDQKHEEYNKFANAEYDTMISNRLSNIIDSGSVQDWELAEDNAFLRKTFREVFLPKHITKKGWRLEDLKLLSQEPRTVLGILILNLMKEQILR